MQPQFTAHHARSLAATSSLSHDARDPQAHSCRREAAARLRHHDAEGTSIDAGGERVHARRLAQPGPAAGADLCLPWTQDLLPQAGRDDMDRRGAGESRLLENLIIGLDHDPREQFFSPYPAVFMTAEIERWMDYIMDVQIR